MFKGILVVDNITYSQISLYCSNIKLLLILLIVNNRQKVIQLCSIGIFHFKRKGVQKYVNIHKLMHVLIN
jgi:hypothetical protein